MSIGFRVYAQRPLPSPEVVEGFRGLAAAPVSDCMGRLSAMHAGLRLMSPPTGRSMAGPALTVKARSGDNLLLHKALDMAAEGDVIVFSNAGDRSRALIGEVMLNYAKFKKIAGMVIDGPIRDVDCLADLGLPVYATGSTAGGPYKVGPGEINVPVVCCGISVEPGDIILGDSDGVVVIPSSDAPALLEAARDYAVRDDARLPLARSGTWDRSWVDTTLLAAGCELIDGMWKA